MNIEGIPETITRKAMVELVESLGMSVRDLISLNFRFGAIEATMYATDSEGNRYFAGGPVPKGVERYYMPEIAVHHVSIQVVDA